MNMKFLLTTGFGDAGGKESACQRGQSKRHGFHPWVGKVPWRRKWHPTPVFLPGESHGRSSLADCSPQGRKEWDTTEQLSARCHKRDWTPCPFFSCVAPILISWLCWYEKRTKHVPLSCVLILQPMRPFVYEVRYFYVDLATFSLVAK